jgi:hypothetical protein
MILVIVLFAAALALASAAGLFSVIGLAITYGGSFWSIVALGSTIEAGKLVAVSFLYRFWDKITITLKIVLSTMVIGVMIVTSLGVFGYLTKANQTDMIGLKQTIAQQEQLADELKRLEVRKSQIDEQIAQLPSNFVNARIRLQREFDVELKEINSRIPEIVREQSHLAGKQIEQQADIGPLVFIARTIGYDIDVATTWFTLLLVFVFDPLAVILTICGNIAYVHHISTRGQKLVLVSEQPLQPDSIGDLPPKTNTTDVDISAAEIEEEEVIQSPPSLPQAEFSPSKTSIYYTATPPLRFAELEGIDLPPFEIFDNTVEPANPVNDHLSDQDETRIRNDWVHFYNKNLSRAAATTDKELEVKISQLKEYVAELDSRSSELSVDEIILRDRIVNFIERHKNETTLGKEIRTE